MIRRPCTPYVGLFFGLPRSDICGTANQNESPVTIAAIDIAFFVNFQPDSRMAQGGAALTISGASIMVARLAMDRPSRNPANISNSSW